MSAQPSNAIIIKVVRAFALLLWREGVGLFTRHSSHVTCHMSHVTLHTSHVTRHTSRVTPHTSHTSRSLGTGIPMTPSSSTSSPCSRYQNTKQSIKSVHYPRHPATTPSLALPTIVQAIAVNDIQDVRPIIRHVTAHPHGVAASYDELLKNSPGKKSALRLKGGGGGVFSQFVVNQAPQVLRALWRVSRAASRRPGGCQRGGGAASQAEDILALPHQAIKIEANKTEVVY